MLARVSLYMPVFVLRIVPRYFSFTLALNYAFAHVNVGAHRSMSVAHDHYLIALHGWTRHCRGTFPRRVLRQASSRVIDLRSRYIERCWTCVERMGRRARVAPRTRDSNKTTRFGWKVSNANILGDCNED